MNDGSLCKILYDIAEKKKKTIISINDKIDAHIYTHCDTVN